MMAGLVTMLVVHMSGTIAWTWYVLVGTAVTLAVGSLFAKLSVSSPS